MAEQERLQSTGRTGILVVRPGAVGDLVVALPVFEALRKAFPHARLNAMAYPRLSGLLTDCSWEPSGGAYAHDCFAFSDSLFMPLFSEEVQPGGGLRQALSGFSTAVVLNRDEDGIFRKRLTQLGIQSIWHTDADLAPNRHVCDELAESLPSNIRPSCAVPRLHALAEPARRAERAIQELALVESPVVIHPGSGGQIKCWPAGSFAELVGRLAVTLGQRILVCCGPADERVLWRFRQKAEPGSYALLPPMQLPELSALLGRARGYVGSDSGVSHVSAAAGCPTLAIFGPTDPARWAPRGERVRIISGRTDATDAAPDGGLSRLSVEEVTGVFLDFIGLRP